MPRRQPLNNNPHARGVSHACSIAVVFAASDRLDGSCNARPEHGVPGLQREGAPVALFVGPEARAHVEVQRQPPQLGRLRHHHCLPRSVKAANRLMPLLMAFRRNS